MKQGLGISVISSSKRPSSIAPPAATVRDAAYVFTGANSVSLPTAISLTTFTYMFYVKTAWTSGTTYLIDARDSSTDGLRIQQTAVGVLNPIYNASGAATNVTAGTWVHFAMTSDGTNLKTYINGALSVTQAIASVISVTTPPRIGARNFSTVTGFWKGQLSQLSVWNVTLSQAQIATKLDQFYADVADKTGLVHWWPLTNITTSTVTDLHGSNHGTIQP